MTISLAILTQMTGLIRTFTQNNEFRYLSAANTEHLNDFIPEQKWNDIENPISFYNIGISKKKQDNFKYTWIFDLNFQRNSLASMINSAFIEEDALSFLWQTGRNDLGLVIDRYVVNSNYQETTKLDNQYLFDKMIVDSWNATNKPRIETALRLQSFFVKEDKNIKVRLHWRLEKLLKALGFSQIKMLDYNTLNKISQIEFEKLDLDKQAIFYMTLLELILFYDSCKSSFLHLNQEIENLWAKDIDFGDMCRTLFWPTHHLNSWIVNDFQQKEDLDFDYNAVPHNFTNTLPMLMISSQMHDDSRYQIITSAISKGYYISKVEVKKYAEEHIIVIIYLSLAIIFVLISFLAIQKQDFR